MRIAKVENETGAIVEVLYQTRLGEVLPDEGQTLFLLDSYTSLRHLADETLISDYTFDFADGKWKGRQAAVPLDVVKTDKLTEIKSKFNLALFEGYVTSTGIKMDSDFDSIGKLSSLMNLAQLTGTANLEVRDFNNVTHQITHTDLTQMLIEMGGNVQTLFGRKWALSDSVNTATTPEEVAAINW